MRMKTLKKLLPLLLLLSLALSLCAGMSAFADYTYTVRVYPGVNAVMAGGTPFIEGGHSYNDSFSFDISKVSLTADGAKKYYIMGLRESGKDNSDVGKSYLYPISGSGSVNTANVTKDIDYVVAYGIEGNQVSLTLSCVNGNTGAVFTTETYYGNPGEVVLIKAPYVDGYNPERTFVRATLGTTTTGTVRYFPVTTTTTIIETGGTTAGGNAGANTGANACPVSACRGVSISVSARRRLASLPVIR